MQDRLIRQMRDSLGLTQQQFADILDVSQATVSRWEAGRVVPEAAMRRRIHALVRDHGGMADGALLSFIRCTPSITALMDLDMRIIAVSDQAAAVNQLSCADAIGLDYRSRFTADVEEAYDYAFANGFFGGEGMGLQLVCQVQGLRRDVTFNTISTWHLLPRPSNGETLLVWAARHVDDQAYAAAISDSGRISMLTLESWLQDASRQTA